MRYLLISLCLLTVGCSSYPKKNNFVLNDGLDDNGVNNYFSDSSLDYVYKANIKIKEHNFGGIFIVKKITSNSHRIVFTTEMGNKLFDFSFQGDTFKINYILKELDKKILINLLKTDFKVLILENPMILNSYSYEDYSVFNTKLNSDSYYYFKKNGSLEKIIKVKNQKEKVVFAFSEINNYMAKNIQILHNKMNIEISLTKI